MWWNKLRIMQVGEKSYLVTRRNIFGLLLYVMPSYSSYAGCWFLYTTEQRMCAYSLEEAKSIIKSCNFKERYVVE